MNVLLQRKHAQEEYDQHDAMIIQKIIENKKLRQEQHGELMSELEAVKETRR